MNPSVNCMLCVAATPGGWAPQGQFIQQLPTHQLEELRYHHPQYSVATYHQPTATPGIKANLFVPVKQYHLNVTY